MNTQTKPETAEPRETDRSFTRASGNAPKKDWEKWQKGKWILWRLDEQQNGEQRWSIAYERGGNYGVCAYLTCDEVVAKQIVKGLAVIDHLQTSQGRECFNPTMPITFGESYGESEANQ